MVKDERRQKVVWRVRVVYLAQLRGLCQCWSNAGRADVWLVFEIGIPGTWVVTIRVVDVGQGTGFPFGSRNSPVGLESSIRDQNLTS